MDGLGTGWWLVGGRAGAGLKRERVLAPARGVTDCG